MDRRRRVAVAFLSSLIALACLAPAVLGAGSGKEDIRVGVRVLDFDPIMDSGVPLTVDRAWFEPTTLHPSYIADIATASGGVVRQRVVDTSLIRDYPVKSNGFKFTNATYQSCLVNEPTNDCKALIDYGTVLNTVYDRKKGSACDALRRGRVDEIWLWGGPWFGYLEWSYVSAQTLCPSVRKPFVVMGFSYEREVSDMLHDLGHRAEGLVQAGIGFALWDRFDGQRERYAQDFFCPAAPDATHPEIADPANTHAGNVHFPPNAFCHYQFDRDFPVMSDADDWANFPNLTGAKRLINSDEWGGTQRGFTIWWLGRFPRHSGTAMGVERDWWRYVYLTARTP